MSFNFGGDSGGFSFGGSDSSSAGFSFGGSDSKENKATNKPTADEKKTSEPSFSFGATTSTPSFSFGDSSQTKKTHSLEDKDEPKKKTKEPSFSIETSSTPGGFEFGGEKTSEKEGTNSFGESKKKENKETTFSFGAGGDGPKDTNSAKTENTFSFGGSEGGNEGGNEPNSDKKEVKGILSTPVEILNLKNKTVEEIINKWNIELEEDVTTFTKLAIQASKWDKELLINEEKV
jgi:hypothetical protein